MSTKKAQSTPQGRYLPAVREGMVIYTSGMTPRVNGVLKYRGEIKAAKKSKKYRKALRLAAGNALRAAKGRLREDEVIIKVLQMSVFLNTEQGFTKHAKVADYASNLLVEELGAGSIGSRAAIGVATLPSNAPVEVTLVCTVGKKNKKQGDIL